MNTPLKQHLIDPEICIRCYTCEMTCPLGAIEHDDNNVVGQCGAVQFLHGLHSRVPNRLN
jgi:benzoyl-CoA 2,3-dioxygenase component A